MAGIDYQRTDGSGVRGWTAVLTDPAEAWDAGGQAPVWIVHRKHHSLPREFARTLRTAVAEAVFALKVPQPEAVIADLGIATCEEAAVVRIGPQAGAVVRVVAYRQFVQQLAAALGRGGVPAAAVHPPAKKSWQNHVWYGRDDSGLRRRS